MEKLLKATNEKKEYRCRFCGRLFQNPQALKMHEKWGTCQKENHSQQLSKQPDEADNFDEVTVDASENGDIVEPSSSEDVVEEPEILSLEDLIDDAVNNNFACSECGAVLTGDEESCPNCGEAFE